MSFVKLETKAATVSSGRDVFAGVVGCLLEGLGGCLGQHSDQQKMVSHRETVTYKCSRTERCYAWNTVSYEESTFEDNISEHGKLNRSGLCQSHC